MRPFVGFGSRRSAPNEYESPWAVPHAWGLTPFTGVFTLTDSVDLLVGGTLGGPVTVGPGNAIGGEGLINGSPHLDSGAAREVTLGERGLLLPPATVAARGHISGNTPHKG